MRKQRLHAQDEKERDALEKKRKCNQNCIKDGKRGTDCFLTDTLRIPPDIATGTVRVTLTGDKSVWVENYQGILDYSEQKMILQGKKERITIEGEMLSIVYYTCDDMLIRGKIRNIRIEGQ